MTKARWIPALLLLSGASCGEAPFLASPGSELTVFANPTFIVANGGVSVISALVVEPNGTLAPNGMVVQFFTTLGSIEPQGKTRDGIARVNLVADARSGTADVTAVSGGEQRSMPDLVTIGSANPKTLVLTANPPRITSPRYSRLTANVFDERGNPVSNVPVIFSIVEADVQKSLESLESGGVPQFTDTNGQAGDILYTRAPRGGPQAIVRVRAETPNGVSDFVRLTIN